MPSLTIILQFQAQFTATEMNVILRALDSLDEPNDEAAHELAKKLRQQRDAFVRTMQAQIKEEPEGNPDVG